MSTDLIHTGTLRGRYNYNCCFTDEEMWDTKRSSNMLKGTELIELIAELGFPPSFFKVILPF